MKGTLYWPAAPSGTAVAGGNTDLTMMMRVAAHAAAPVEVEFVDTRDRLHLDGHDFLVVSDAHIDDEMVEVLTDARIRWVQLSSSGSERAMAAGLSTRTKLTNAATVWAPSVADHAIALLLALVRQIPRLIQLKAAREWSPTTAAREARTVSELTAVVLGCGAIGCEIAARLSPFGIRTIGVNRRGSPRAGTAFSQFLPLAKLHVALAEADILFVSLPLRPETRHLIGARELELLGPDSYLINVARGAIIDTAALESAVLSNALAGIAVDVTDPEPLPSHNVLWSSDRVIVSPHVASHPASRAAGQALGYLVRENARRLEAGEELLGPVS